MTQAHTWLTVLVRAFPVLWVLFAASFELNQGCQVRLDALEGRRSPMAAETRR
jgi:hypothetical protein